VTLEEREENFEGTLQANTVSLKERSHIILFAPKQSDGECSHSNVHTTQYMKIP